ncbi:MAG: transposase [Acidobacteria bacterium]|nr:transposase [Acidobacteriota bacterium]
MLLREVKQRTGSVRRLAACFVDHREPERLERMVAELAAQRVYSLALGYEDLNDHDQVDLAPATHAETSRPPASRRVATPNPSLD